MKKILFRLLYGNSFRLTPLILFKLRHYFKVMKLMKEMQDHIVDKSEYEMLLYWESSYRAKIYFLLNKKFKQVSE